MAYHDAPLALTLLDSKFGLHLFVIPWLMTAFAHILPLDDVVALWDALILHPLPPPSTPPSQLLLAAAALILLLRDAIVGFSFDALVDFFVDPPPPPVSRLVSKMRELHVATPPCVLAPSSYDVVRPHEATAEGAFVVRCSRAEIDEITDNYPTFLIHSTAVQVDGLRCDAHAATRVALEAVVLPEGSATVAVVGVDAEAEEVNGGGGGLLSS